MANECIFCKIAKGEIPAEKLMDTDDLVAFRDIHPKASTHMLIVPKEHIPTMNNVTGDKSALIAKMFIAAKDLAKKEGVSESGYRTIVNCNRDAGQEVFHLHMHVIGGRPLGPMA